MNISTEMFEAIIRSIRGDGHDAKRKYPRVGFSGRMTIVPLPPAKNRKPVLVVVRDLSAGGIGILHTEAFKAGQQFTLYMKSQNTGKTSTILCTVRWSRSVGSNLHEIGAQFENREPAQAAPTQPAEEPKPKSKDG